MVKCPEGVKPLPQAEVDMGMGWMFTAEEL